MPNITIPNILCRTTRDGAGHPHGLAVSTDTSLDEALRESRGNALERVEEIAEGCSRGEHESDRMSSGA